MSSTDADSPALPASGGDRRQLPVPDSLDGERVDAAVAQLFGLSRTRSADLIAQGLVLVDGASARKSDRVLPGSALDITIPAVADPLEVKPETVEGINILHDDPAPEAGENYARLGTRLNTFA